MAEFDSTIADFIGTLEACDMLGCSQRTLYRLLAEKKIRGYKPAGKLRFRRDELEMFITSAPVGAA